MKHAMLFQGYYMRQNHLDGLGPCYLICSMVLELQSTPYILSHGIFAIRITITGNPKNKRRKLISN